MAVTYLELIANSEGEGLAAVAIADLMGKIDEHIVLAAMPAMEPEHVVGRLSAIESTLSDSTPKQLLAILTEVRYYQSKQLATVEQAVAMYDRILGPGKGRLLATGQPAPRREVVQQWLDSL